MRILVSGGSGLVGRQLITDLILGGHQVVQLVRRHPDPDARSTEIEWDPQHDALDASALRSIGSAVHLGGVSVAGGRWSPERKLLIQDSRVRSTRLISRALAGMPEPPKVLIVASAVGYYGDRGEEQLTEESPPGDGFLAETARHWEAAADDAREAGIRVVHARFGLVVSRQGGILAKMKMPFQTALGGRLGDGRQWWSWMSLADVVAGLAHVLATDELSGPVNFTAPNPVRNAEFTRLLAKTLSRPAWLNVPAPLVKLVFGQMGSETMLYSQRADPEKLRASGFKWTFNELAGAMRHELN